MTMEGNMSDESKAIVPMNATTALEPSNVDEAFRLCERLVQSGLLGKNIQKPQAALAVILAGRELGLTAMQSLRSIHIIEGKPTLSADLMVALVKRSPKCLYFKLINSTSKLATYETDRAGEGVTRMSWTIEQAQAAGVAGKDNWKRYPDAMLRARCIAALARAVYPDLLAGVYEENELVAAPVVQPQPLRSVPPQVTTSTAPEAVDVEFAVAEQETDDERIARWTDIINGAETLDRLKAIAREIKAEPMSEAVRSSLLVAYGQRKKELEEAA